MTLDKYNALSLNDAYVSTVYLFDPPYTNGSAFSFGYSGTFLQTALDSTETHFWGDDIMSVVAQESSYPHGALQNETASTQLTYPHWSRGDPQDVSIDDQYIAAARQIPSAAGPQTPPGLWTRGPT